MNKQLKTMNKIKTSLIISIFALLLFSACSKEQGPQGPSGPSLSGTFVGFVTLYDQYGDVMSNDSGVLVSVVGKNISATTNANGRYILPGLTTGVYDFTFTKVGYGSAKTISQNFVGGDTQFLGTIKTMSQIPNFSVTGLSLLPVTTKNPLNNYIKIAGSVNATDTKDRKVIFFVSNQNNVSYLPANYMYTATATILADSTNFTFDAIDLTLYQAGLPSGSTAYVAAYASAYQNTSSSVFDINTGRTLFNAINTSGSSSSIIMP